MHHVLLIRRTFFTLCVLFFGAVGWSAERESNTIRTQSEKGPVEGSNSEGTATKTHQHGAVSSKACSFHLAHDIQALHTTTNLVVKQPPM
jgi:hypothetical protein